MANRNRDMGHRDRSDQELLEADFGAFYDRYLGAVGAFVGGRVRAPDVGFDVVAETFARALEKRAQYDPARAPAIAWLIGIARNLIVDAARRGQVEASSRVRLGMAPVELYDEQLDAVAEFNARDLGVALAGLPVEQRDAVLKRVVLEQPYPTIAEELRCSEQVVRKRVSRGLAALRTNLEGERR
jgi:RNA polymerase sigma factor (sigma-70 family)